MRPKFNSETARAAGKIGGPARARALSPLRRSMIGVWAAQARWYPMHAPDVERIKAYLRRLALIVAQAMKDNEPDRAIRAIAVMGPYERMRIALREQAPREAGGLSDEAAEDLFEFTVMEPSPAGADLNGGGPGLEAGFEAEDENR